MLVWQVFLPALLNCPYRMTEEVDRLAGEVYKIAEGICKTADDGVPLSY